MKGTSGERTRSNRKAALGKAKSRLEVPLTGLEPVLSALRGRRVNHLHYSGISRTLLPPD